MAKAPVMMEPIHVHVELRDTFNAMSVEDLTHTIGVAEGIRQVKLEDAKKALIAEFRQKASALGVTFESLLSGHGSPPRIRRASDNKLAVKFRGPNGEKWSGRGRLPTWLQEAEKAGRKREEFAA